MSSGVKLVIVVLEAIVALLCDRRRPAYTLRGGSIALDAMKREGKLAIKRKGFDRWREWDHLVLVK